MQASIAGLPDELARQGASLGTLAPVVDEIGTETERLAEEIRQTRSHLAEADELLDEYRSVLAEARIALDRAPPPAAAGILRFVTVVVGLGGIVLGSLLWRLGGAVADTLPEHRRLVGESPPTEPTPETK